MEIIEQKVFKATDGKMFLDEKECTEYEEVINNIQYFKLCYAPDLTETGLLLKNKGIIVYAEHGYHKEIVLNYIHELKGHIIGPSVMGYGYQPHFNIIPLSKKEFDKYIIGKKDTIFISNKEITGFPEPFNFYKEWGFK